MRAKNLFIVMFMIACSAMLFAQYTTIDFEPAGQGAAWNWVVGENGANPPLTFPANPVMGGINTSPTVAQFTATDAGVDWALCYTDDIQPFQFNASNAMVKIMVYKPVISNVALKFEGSSAPLELQIPNTLINQWEELTFNFSAAIGNTYNRLVIIPDFAPRAQDNLLYFDNIRIPEANILPPAVPTVAAPDPTELAADVISIYSDAYANVPGANYNPNWGQSTIVTIDEPIAGNNTLHYQNLNYQGTEYPNQDVSAYEALHVDFWTDNSTSLTFFLISPGAETGYTLPITPGTWVSVDIPLSFYVPPVNLANVFQFKVVGNGEVWFDNLYFWKTPTSQVSDATLSDLKVDGTTVAGFAPLTENYTYGLLEGTVIIPQITQAVTSNPNATYVINQAAAIPGTASVVVTAQDGTTTKTYSVAYAIVLPNSVPPDPTPDPENVISLFSDAYPDVVVDTWLTPWSQGIYAEELVAGNPVKKYTQVNFVGIETAGANVLDVTAMSHVHLDLWTPDANNFRFKLVDWGADGAWSGGDDTEHELVFPAPASGTWLSYDIPLSAFTGLSITGHMAQYILSKDPLGTMYIDNFYFYAAGPNSPGNVGIIRSGANVTVSWDPVPGATYYTLYGASNPYGPYTEVVGGTYNGTSWTSNGTVAARFFYATASND